MAGANGSRLQNLETFPSAASDTKMDDYIKTNKLNMIYIYIYMYIFFHHDMYIYMYIYHYIYICI